jgi:lipoprotein-anchoring transpeptidase ErfK/SrfK
MAPLATPRQQRPVLVLAAVVAAVIVAAVAISVYDNAQSDKVADGVKAGGVDIGGMSRAKARTTLARELAPRLQQPLWVAWHGKRFKLSPESAGVRVDVNGMVSDAIDKSRGGFILTRAVRSITGGDVNADVPVKLSYSQAAVDAFVKRAEAGLNRPAQDARVAYSSAGIKKVPSHKGVRVVDSKLRAGVESELRNPSTNRTVRAVVTTTNPKITTRQLASKYPSIIVVCRSCFQLKYYRHLKLDHTYTIAVGMQGLETPAGLYDIQDKQVDPSWHVPNSAWAGSLAGRVIPPGPQDPLKARWMGFNGGAGIHGTAESGSLGSAASHGCIRMAVPDVIDLYKHMSVGDPVYIG